MHRFKHFIFFVIALIVDFSLRGSSVTKEAPAKHHRLEFVFQTAKPTQELLAALTLAKVAHDNTLSSIVEITQKEWLRKAGTERWGMQDTHVELRQTITPLLKQLKLVDEIVPCEKQFTYGIIFGSIMTLMRQRLAYALTHWEQGIRFENLVFFVGAQPLDPQEDSDEVLYDEQNSFLPFRSDWKKPAIKPLTEKDVALLMIEQTQFPVGFKNKINFIVVETPLQQENGVCRRPNTGDTVKQFKPHLIKNPGTILALSNQPFVGYQHSVITTLLPGFYIETIGPKVQEPIHVSITLDSLARWLYQENQRQMILKRSAL